MATLLRPSKPSCTANCAALVNELMNARTSFHKLHLKVSGSGSFAQHLALNDLYDALPSHADTLAEQYQGACGMLLDIPDTVPRKLGSIKDATAYLDEIARMVTSLQGEMPYSEIVNDLDTVKGTLNTARYKLKFLA